MRCYFSGLLKGEGSPQQLDSRSICVVISAEKKEGKDVLEPLMPKKRKRKEKGGKTLWNCYCPTTNRSYLISFSHAFKCLIFFF